MEAVATTDKEAFQLKGSLFTLSVLQLYTGDIATIDTQLSQTIATSPKFFHYAPIVIDLSQLDEDTNIAFTELNQLLRQHHLIPIGIRGGTASQRQDAQQVGLATLAESKANATLASRQLQPKATTTSDNTIVRKTKWVDTPVRSGQQIYAEDGDLIVTATVSNGAEIIADGHIHVYATLRGRAVAGAAGDTSAVIFCHDLQAEMVSIAGRYRLHAETASTHPQQNVKVYLVNGRVCIENY